MRIHYLYKVNIIAISLLAVMSFACVSSKKSAGKKEIVVDINGNGDFTSIQSAINSLSDSSAATRIIHIRPGTYHEKIFITKHNITLQGDDRDRTVITQDIARDEWRCDHADDWGVATLNLNGNDITLVNLTIANDYGFNFKEPRTVT
jgi:pectinesterase